MDSRELASKIDYTLLKIGVSEDTIKSFVEMGLKFMVRGLVVTPSNIPLLKKYLRGGYRPKLVSVVSFPYGETFLSVKYMEIDKLVEEGVDELDIVLNTSYIIQGKIDRFREEASNIMRYVRDNYPSLTVKLIVEVTILQPNILKDVIKVINEVKPDYFKTSTGYGPRGTQVDDIIMIKKYLAPSIGLKAAGGIRKLKQAIELINAGADIIGSSAGIEIIKEALSKYG